MPSQSQLQSAFKVYFDEIQRCIKRKCYWALLHIVIVLPDICAALETERGKAEARHYIRWCDRYLASPSLSGEEWYEIRNIVLHQGKSLARKGRYQSYRFTKPNTKGISFHLVIHEKNGKKDCTLDVGRMARAVRRAMVKWFGELEADEDNRKAHNVEKYLPSLVRVHSGRVSLLEARFTTRLSLTTSSPL